METRATAPPVYQLIENGAELERLCREFAKAERLAVDTEFVREKSYFPRLEVLQISDGNRIILIDVPAVGNLQPLRELFVEAPVLKIFHAADQDIDILNGELGAAPAPIFDTQIAASLLGYGQQVSLANLVRTVLEKEVISGQSVSDWTARPLTVEQLHYAASDVEHLHALHAVLLEGLRSRGREGWYEDEQAQRVASITAPGVPDEELYRKVKDWASLSRQELAVLRELAQWREQTARQRNCPRRSVLTDDGLIDIARFQPNTKAKAARLRRVNPGQINRYFEELQEVIRRGRAVPKDQWPEKPKGERRDLPTGLVEICRALLRAEADRHEIAAAVVATNSDLQDLLNNRDRLEEKTGNPLMHGWRYELVGKQLVDLLQGRLVVRVGEEGDLVFENREG